MWKIANGTLEGTISRPEIAVKPKAAEILRSLRKLVERLGPEISLQRFTRETGISTTKVFAHWQSWSHLRRYAGLKRRAPMPKIYTDEELLREMNRVCGEINHYPTRSEFDRLARLKWQTLERRFGPKEQIIRVYREWLHPHQAGLSKPESEGIAEAKDGSRIEVPEFLRGCPLDHEPTMIPGLFLPVFTSPTTSKEQPGSPGRGLQGHTSKGGLVSAVPEDERPRPGPVGQSQPPVDREPRRGGYGRGEFFLTPEERQQLLKLLREHEAKKAVEEGLAES
ncbi:hypothetical protein Plim_1014 [Planctopirus limnophila DSM 3776]|uniref:Uncharacterized protein n=1 Tax=Planctopirus limnophila (strain ATCC 43296 / DSM 3776 / IFAM 1008 / Mu 290) TaxID=521674 RepID=D5ST89_PLAL2|nr:hypothetical protein Plim_1014 [Planctopirus limnophila DSM 3776]